MVGKPLEPFQTTKYYYDAMLKKAKQIADSGMSTLDEHDLDMPGQDKGELAKGALNRTVKNAAKQSAGDIPGNLSNVLDALGKPEIRWESLLRNFVFSNVSNQTKYTTKRAHRRFDMPSPGKKKKRQMNIGVCIDVSGSVSDEQCSAFFTEIQSIAKQVTKVYLVQADTEIQHVEEIKNKKFKKERKGYGGTAYQPAINKCKELGCDVIVYFGDGDSADTPVDPKVPFLWVMCGGGSPPASFGKTIKLGV
jgi:predicted metal-dependent peptidase